MHATKILCLVLLGSCGAFSFSLDNVVKYYLESMLQNQVQQKFDHQKQSVQMKLSIKEYKGIFNETAEGSAVKPQTPKTTDLYRILPHQKYQQTDANDYIDIIFRDVHLGIVNQGQDPFPVSNVGVMGIQIQGEISDYSAWQREGDVEVLALGNILSVSVTVEILDITGSFTWSIPLVAHGTAIATMNKLTAILLLRGTIPQNSNQVILMFESFTITDMSDVMTEVSGSGQGATMMLLALIASLVANLLLALIPSLTYMIVIPVLSNVLSTNPFTYP